MSFFPVNQVRLTNVAIVRLKKHGKRFEVAAYKNKVLNWRNRVETDIDEVLQKAQVFSNVSKGIIAKGEDMKEAFGTDDHMKVALIILDKGELEVSDKERALLFDQLFRDIATIIADKCLNPDTRRPYTVTIIEKALRDAHFSINPAKSAKQQALKAIQLLQGHIPIERARMRVRLTLPSAESTGFRAWLLDTLHASIDGEGVFGDVVSIDATIEPGFYRAADEEVSSRGRGRGTLEVLSLSVLADNPLDDKDDAPNMSSARDTAKGDGQRAGGSGSSAAVAGVAGVAASMAGLGLSASSSSSQLDDAGGSARPESAAAGAGRGDFDAALSASSRGTGMLVRRVAQPGRRLACGTCGLTFEASDEHREHHKSEFHRYNMKCKMKGMDIVDEETFKKTPAAAVKALLESYE